MTPGSAGRPHLTVVVPAYNEEERLARSLPAITAYLDAEKIASEIIVVDDGSTDGTARIAGEHLTPPRGRLLRSPENLGKGSAVRQGILAARGSWVLLTDADLSTPIEEHAKLAAVARDHDVDVVIGSRALPGSQVEVHQNLLRETMGKTFNVFVRSVMGLPFHDTQCGFKLMGRQRVQPLFELMRVDGFAYDVELLFLCKQFGIPVHEVPVTWRNDPRSAVSLVGDPLQMLSDLLRIRWTYRRGHYRRKGDKSI